MTDIPAAPSAADPDAIGDGVMLDHVTAEVMLLGKLVEGKFLTTPDRAWVLGQLERRGQSRSGFVSVLHLTQDRIRTFAEALLFLSRDSGMPLLPLLRFVPQKAAAALVPPLYRTCLGVLPFDTLGEDLLVAVMNPYDEAIRNGVRARAGRHCTFFLVSPLDYDSALRVAGKDSG